MAEGSSTTETNASKTASSNNLKMIVFAVIGVIFAVWIGFRLFGNNPAPATLSGSLNFNGIKPADQPNKAVSIKLLQRVKGEASFVDSGIMIPVADQAAWKWDTAASGTTYELKAEGYYGTEPITTTNTIIATAPATDLMLTFNVSTDDLPVGLRPTPAPVEPEATPAPANSIVSGSIIINGFIPSGSRVTIFGRPSGTDDKYVPALQNLPARNGMTWSFNQATAGKTYDYQAELYTSGGTFIGESSYITVTAPAANEIVTINSTATDPTQTAALSGVVRLQGPVAQNSTILVLQRKVGAAEYTTIDRYPAVNNTEWKWSGAVTGTAYEITAALQVNEQNTASGNVVTVTAPATGITVTIDTGVNLSAPTQTVSVDCGTPDGTNHFNARIGIPQNSNAKMYYLEVGTAAGSNNTFANTVKPDQSPVVYVAGGSPYFARYSWSACADCNLKDTGNWAGWSPTYGFICNASGQATTYTE